MCHKAKPCTCGKALSFVFGGQPCDTLKLLGGLRLEKSFEVGRTAREAHGARWGFGSSRTFRLETRKTAGNLRQIGQ